jgi:hypothetical protein
MIDFEVRIRPSKDLREELRSCSSFEPSPVGVTPPPAYRGAPRTRHDNLRRGAMTHFIFDVNVGPLHHR